MKRATAIGRRSRSYLMPPSPSEWLPPGHLAYLHAGDVVETLEHQRDRACGTGQGLARRSGRYPPRLMVAIMLYGYAIGIVSSRRLARADANEDVAFRVIVGEAHPSFTTMNQCLPRPPRRVSQAVRGGLALVPADRLGQPRARGYRWLQDIKANVSKHKAMSYDRMQQSETRIEQEVDAIARAAEADAAEDAQYGAGKMPEDVPAELRRREDRLAQIAAQGRIRRGSGTGASRRTARAGGASSVTRLPTRRSRRASAPPR